MSDIAPVTPDPVAPEIVAPAAAPAADPIVEAAPAPADPAAPAADPADPAPAGNPADWPEDWRQKYSTDPSVLKRLERYASPKAALDALFAAQNRISKGDLLPTLKDNPTPEEVADYRSAHGIPETAAGYDLTLPNGIVVGEADRPFVDSFLAKAHDSNMHPEQVQQALGWYYDQQEQNRIAQDARDTESKMMSEDELRAEFGPDFRRNVMLANQLLDSAPGDIKEKFLGGRMADGTPIGNDPNVIRWLVGLSREINPVSTVVPGSGTNAVQAVEAEIGNLRKMMGDNKSEYWKGPNAAKNQARYRDLTSALQKQAAR